ncbi:gp59 [Sphingomonas phage PAU]|uniref:gp59 n=1 Tax=Sphingomonas phage PAU TaxID=1150991 RepID=UPI00025731C5|nr:gp59 [Sphingomonas phage PAU]AFF28057.1 gp59 [Sphingomonas phage PAU]
MTSTVEPVMFYEHKDELIKTYETIATILISEDVSVLRIEKSQEGTRVLFFNKKVENVLDLLSVLKFNRVLDNKSNMEMEKFMDLVFFLKSLEFKTSLNCTEALIKKRLEEISRYLNSVVFDLTKLPEPPLTLETIKTGDTFYYLNDNLNIVRYEFREEYPMKSKSMQRKYFIVIDRCNERPIRVHFKVLEKMLEANIRTLKEAKIVKLEKYKEFVKTLEENINE